MRSSRPANPNEMLPALPDSLNYLLLTDGTSCVEISVEICGMEGEGFKLSVRGRRSFAAKEIVGDSVE